MLIAEDFLLMALDVDSGRTRPGLGMLRQQRFAAACLLAELAVQKQAGVRNDRVHLYEAMPTYHPLLSEALASLRERAVLAVGDAIAHLARQLGDIEPRLIESLIARGVLHEGGRRRFLLFGERGYPVRSTQARNEALANALQAASGDTHHMRAIALLLLADGSGSLPLLVDEQAANEGKARAHAFTEEVREVREHSPSTDLFDVHLASMSLLASIHLALAPAAG
mgnify:CR=1 FL=1